MSDPHHGAPAAHGHGDDHGDDHGHGHGSRFIQHHYDDAQHQFDSGKLGIWLFLGQEVLFFSALFVAYVLYRHHHPEIYSYAHKYLDVKYGAINTAVLIFSSLTAAWAVRAAQMAQRKLLIACLSATVLCALTFLGIKYIEYKHKIHEHILFGRYFDPCVSSGGTHLLTKNNLCAGHKSTVVWDYGAAAATEGCFKDIDQNPNLEGVQAKCKVDEVKLEFYQAKQYAAGASHDCAKVPAVHIQGNGGTYTITGACEAILVVGDGNTVSFDTAKKVAVKGQKNQLRGTAAGAFAGEAGNSFNVPKGLGAATPALGAVSDADVDRNIEYVREVGRKPIAEQCPAEATGHGEHAMGEHAAAGEHAGSGNPIAVGEPMGSGAHGAPAAHGGHGAPCWRIGFQPAVCKRDLKQNKDAFGVIVEYGDHEEREREFKIDAKCEPTPAVPAVADPLADKPQTVVLGEKAIAPSQQLTAHEEHEREAAGPPPEHTNMFFTIYFAMTGLHGIHVLVGVFVFIWLLVRAVKGHFTPDYFGPVDFAALYWHIVDLIWIFLFPLLYLIH